MTFEQMAVQQSEIPGHVDEVAMETAGVIDVPSEITAAEFESPTETQTPMEKIDTTPEVQQEVTEVTQEVTAVSETQYIVHTAGMDVTSENSS